MDYVDQLAGQATWWSCNKRVYEGMSTGRRWSSPMVEGRWHFILETSDIIE